MRRRIDVKNARWTLIGLAALCLGEAALPKGARGVWRSVFG
jgi:hypothetical protein